MNHLLKNLSWNKAIWCHNFRKKWIHLKSKINSTVDPRTSEQKTIPLTRQAFLWRLTQCNLNFSRWNLESKELRKDYGICRRVHQEVSARVTTFSYSNIQNWSSNYTLESTQTKAQSMNSERSPSPTWTKSRRFSYRKTTLCDVPSLKSASIWASPTHCLCTERTATLWTLTICLFDP